MTGAVTLVLNSLSSGGAEKQLLWIAGEIVSMGTPCCIHELVACESNDRIEAMVRVATAKGVQVHRAPRGSGIVRGLWRLRGELRDCRPALIWSWGLRADLVCYLCRPRKSPAKWVMSIRSANVKEGLFVSLITHRLTRSCSGMISNTRRGLIMRRVPHHSGLREWFLPNAITVDCTSPLDLPSSPPARLVLVMLGNIRIRTKGYDLAAELARVLRDKHFSFELRIAGRPDELRELQELFRQLDVESLVKFCGEVSHPDKFLREGHLFLILSRFEGLPNTLLEALNVGLPAIATDVGDLRMLKEKGGPFVLIPIEDVSAAAEAVETAVARWSETRMAAAKGRSWVQENFSEAACRALLREILDEILKT